MKAVFNAFKNQRGALFGMDARLALMVFTVLTGTLGYFAYGKLKAVREVALVKELTAVDYALHSYQTDMGTFIPFTVETPLDKEKPRNDMSILWSMEKILSRYTPMWNGPYVDFDSENHNMYGLYNIIYMTDDHTPCTAYTNCYSFIEITSVPEEIWTQVNVHFDEARGHNPEGISDAHLLGRVRADGLTDPRTLWFKSTSRLKENK